MDLFQKMQANENKFSKSESKVYKTVLDNPQMVELHTITMLAALAGTSTSAVLRFCKTLGYRGFIDFRYDMIQYLHEQAGRNPELPADPVTAITDIYSSALTALRVLDPAKLDRLVHDILSSDVIYNLGLYRSSLIAEKLRYNLEDTGILSVTAKDTISFGHLPLTMTEKSTAIIFSVSGDTVNFHNFFNAAGNTKKIWLVTSNPSAKMKKLVSDVIVLPQTSYDKKYPLDEHPFMMVFVEILSYLVRTTHSQGI